MIKGIGTDIIEIETIKKSIEKSSRFKERVFTEKEIIYCENKPNKYQHYAVRFAAKEAVMKALGTGWSNGVQWKHIEVINKSTGQPDIILSDKAEQRLKEIKGTKIEVSLSHCENYSVAMTIII